VLTAAIDRGTATAHAFLNNAAWRGERALAIVRIAIMALVLIQKAVLDFQRLVDGVVKEWVVVIAALLVVAFSVRAMRPIDQAENIDHRLLLSTLLDATFMVTVFAPALIWPEPDYAGFLRTPYPAALLMTTIAVGFRLSTRIAGGGIALNLAAMVLLIVLDHIINAPRLAYGAYEIVTVSIFMIGAGVMGWMIAARTRKLVYESAETLLRAERTRQRLGAYISEEFVDVALDEGALAMQGGTRRDVAVLFSDLRGFTTYAEGMPPESLIDELNAYLDAMVSAIRAHGGVVDKYIGDAIMVVFGLPAQRGDEAGRAIRTALALQTALEDHNRARASVGLDPLVHGIGVHYGPAVAGNIGTPQRLQFTVVGDTVNVASRLESSTKTLGVPVAISAEAVAAARVSSKTALPDLREVGTIDLRGRQAGLGVFTLGETPPS